MEYRVISSDDHIVEAPSVFDRVPKRMRDNVPHIERSHDKDYWVLDGKIIARVSESGAVGGPKLTPSGEPDPADQFRAGSYETIRAGSYDPVERLKAYDADGIDAGVIFPNGAPVGFGGDPVYSVTDPEVRLACIQSYNDWLVEDFCSVNPERLIPLCVVPSWDAALASAEATRAANKGHRGVIFSPALDMFGQTATFDPYWDPLWAVIQDLDVPVCFHQLGGSVDRPSAKKAATPQMAAKLQAAWGVWHVTSFAEILPEIMLCGMLERFPRLKVFFGESGVGWIPFVLNQMDYTWERNITREGRLQELPSSYWRRQCSAGFWSEPITPHLIDFLGADTILWEGDYPHPISTSPNSQGYIEKSLALVDDPNVKHQITAGNAVRLFHLN